MVTFHGVAEYLRLHESNHGDSRFVQELFEQVRGGAYVLHGAPIELSPAELFRISSPQLTHCFSFRLNQADPLNFTTSFVCFDGAPLELYDFNVLIETALQHISDYVEEDGSEDVSNLSELLDQHGSLEGGLMICASSDEDDQELEAIVACRPWLSGRVNRVLLYTAIKYSFYTGFIPS